MHEMLSLIYFINFKGFPIHFIFETMAYFIGFRYFMYQKKNENVIIEDSNWVWIFIGAIGGGIVGSRLIGALENPALFFSSENKLLYLFSNKTILGGLIGGVFGVEGIKKLIGEKSSSGDRIVFPLIIATIIGRIGCFLNGIEGETLGKQTKFFAAIDFGDGIPRHPIALYEIIFLILIGIFLLRTKSNFKIDEGNLFRLFMIFYLTFRFLSEFYKVVTPVIYNLTTIQLASIFGLIYYYKFIFNTTFKKNYDGW